MEKATVSKAEDRSYRNCFDLGITGKKSTILDMSVTKMPMAAKMMKSAYALEIEMKKGVIGGEIPSEFVSSSLHEDNLHGNQRDEEYVKNEEANIN